MDKRSRGGKRNRGKQADTQLFEDTSFNQNSYAYSPSGYENQQPNIYNPSFPVQSAYGSMPYPNQLIFSDPMANMAMQYGQSIAGQGSQIINQNLEKYMTKSNVKYYFAVDNSYVIKKIGLLIFPFLHKNWSMSHNQEEPVAPRFDVNARDLYIPVMAFVTYTLLAGLLLGMQERFSPEQLGVVSSSALVWSLFEVLLLLFSRYILNLPSSSASSPSFLDWLAYSGYKYVGIIIILVASIFFQSPGYYASLAWMSLSICFFIIKSLRVSLMGISDSVERGPYKRGLYLLLCVALIQPLLMWWLTRSLAMSTSYSFSDHLSFKPPLAKSSPFP